tara:strand:- start:1897 stop:2967 length:1071 start_codon:yes stop_codon:yes gene_type:complete
MDNSAMDGYALISEDVKSATFWNPVPLDVCDEIAAGHVGSETIQRGQAARIMTGAPIPPGADSVVMQEDTEKKGSKILVKDKTEVGENIRLAGEDVEEGEVIIQKGCVIQPVHVGMMAVVGRSSVYVSQQPIVAILSTGDEIKDLDENPQGPCIYNSNGYMLSAQVRSAGAVPVYLGIAPDQEEALRQKFRDALKCDIVLSSGGVSVGDYDLVQSSLDQMGREMAFWKVAMKPGKPLAFGHIGDRPIFGLPGNPVSSFVSFEQFVRPSLKKMMGASQLTAKTVKARLTKTVRKKAGRLYFMSAALEDENGELEVTPNAEQGSGILKSMIHADGLMVFPLEASEMAKGDMVSVQILN